MITRNSCIALDVDDPLSDFRDEFALPAGVIYLDGNSLGAMSKTATEYLQRTVTGLRSGAHRDPSRPCVAAA